MGGLGAREGHPCFHRRRLCAPRQAHLNGSLELPGPTGAGGIWQESDDNGVDNWWNSLVALFKCLAFVLWFSWALVEPEDGMVFPIYGEGSLRMVWCFLFMGFVVASGIVVDVAYMGLLMETKTL